MDKIEIIKRNLKNYLSEYRYEHSLRVGDVAKELASLYHYDMDRAYLAGIIHDIAKEFTDEENRSFVLEHHLDDSMLGDDYKKILHADIGGVIASLKYGLDPEICHAVASHAIGNIPMNLLDQIIFVADKIEPQKQYDGIEEERELAYHNLYEATILCIENNQKKLIRQKKRIYPKSIEVLNYLRSHKQ